MRRTGDTAFLRLHKKKIASPELSADWGTTISAFVEGLLGFAANALEKKISCHPAIPLTWENLQVKNLKVGRGKIDLSFQREQGRVEKKIPGYRVR